MKWRRNHSCKRKAGHRNWAKELKKYHRVEYDVYFLVVPASLARALVRLKDLTAACRPLDINRHRQQYLRS